MKYTKPKVLANGSANMAKCNGKPCGRPCEKRAG